MKLSLEELIQVTLIASSLRYFLIAGLAFLLFYVVFKTRWFPYKIQLKDPKTQDYLREIGYSIFTIFLFSGVAALVFFSPFYQITQIYLEISVYGWGYWFLSIGLMLIIHDTYFYWTHRLMHHPKLFKHTHLVHHQSHNPSPWAALSFHPIEGFIEASVIFVITILIPTTPTAILAFLVIMMVYNVYGHIGYELFPKGTDKHWLGKWFNTSVNHNMHHKYSSHNYGLYFTFWDKLMGSTHPKYHETFEEVKSRKTEPATTTQTII